MNKLILTFGGVKNLPEDMKTPFRGMTKQNQYFIFLLPRSSDWHKVEVYLSEKIVALDMVIDVELQQVKVTSVEVLRDGGTIYIITSVGKFVIPSSLGLNEIKPMTFNGDPVTLL